MAVTVFQYGSNTSIERLNGPDRLQGSAIARGLAETVERFDLAFTRLTRSGWAAADLSPGAGRRIFGVVYDIPEHRVFRSHAMPDIRTLDDIEAEGEAYRRIGIRVRLCADGTLTDAVTYVVKDPQANLRTTPEYVRYIVTGLRSFGAPEEYLDYVKTRARSSDPALAEILRTM
ncbi:MAG TPA: gamma-glutamylcyclotransferase [Burkholderiales bacterium]|nr:gamma-glutamylcyclotransferase [Burkholderiales bacterium]